MKKSIEVHSLSKRYSLKNTHRPSLKDVFFSAWQETLKKETLNLKEEVWALKDISFSLEEGDGLAILGQNGVGKSTLLKILSRLTEPTSGRAILRGKVTSLLELGTGFHPDLTGRENIFLNGAFLGMRKREIEKSLEAIVEFSKLGGVLDQSVKYYSSGMAMRLAIGVALHLDTDILLMDEVMEVLDREFRAKCFSRLIQKRQEGGTVVLISHDESVLKEVCDKGLLLQSGELKSQGSLERVLESYRGTSSGSS